MKDPTQPGPGIRPSPDRMTSSSYFCCGEWGSDDNGGVHYNSGVLNKAAYLIADGDTFNGQTITGIGIPKASQIFYKLESNLLTSASDYEDVYNLLPQACRSLVGSNGITQSDCDQVTKAVIATEMNQQPTSCACSGSAAGLPEQLAAGHQMVRWPGERRRRLEFLQEHRRPFSVPSLAVELALR